ncbi:uncharacterized protein LOC135373125 [Ornithodoros turicata]|uniref:uncharacterized protein LOC135373125 n=1 Tax=Ornithodoros turicata TaxID=34597 RepID=UPI00313953D4
MDMNVVKVTHDSMDEFLTWLDALTTSANSQFCLQKGAATEGASKVYSYVCNRSGMCNSKLALQDRCRQMRSQGSCKIGNMCTAYITARLSLTTGKVVVSGCLSHYYHTTDVQHLRMQQSDRAAIIEDYVRGVPNDRIVRNVRGTMPARVEDLKRSHLTKTADVRNIADAECLMDWKLDKDDGTSVKKMVELFRGSPQNCVLMYKPTGVPHNVSDQPLPTKDFMIVLQTEFQKEMLKLFGAKVVCLDATHGTNGYKFYLITLLVLDAAGEGVPVAWCLSSTENKTALYHFLKAVKESVGEVTPNFFMTDDAKQYYHAWCEAFQSRPRKLLCKWHVRRAWSNKLNSTVKDERKRKEIESTIDVLLQQKTEDAFREKMTSFTEVLQIDESTHVFLQYFEAYYMNRVEEWATCFRTECDISTNMKLESFHKVLKYLFLDKKANKRTDKLIHTLLAYSNWKQFDVLIGSSKGKTTKTMTAIYHAHMRGKEIPVHDITTLDNGKWKVCGTKEYEVLARNTCHAPCQLRCRECNICVHAYICSCPCTLMCKHIHAVHLHFGSSHPPSLPVSSTALFVAASNYPSPVPRSSSPEASDSPVQETDEHPPSLLRPRLAKAFKSLGDISHGVARLLSSTSTPLPNSAENTLATANEAIKAALALKRVLTPAYMPMHPDHDYTPANKRIAPQRKARKKQKAFTTLDQKEGNRP